MFIVSSSTWKARMAEGGFSLIGDEENKSVLSLVESLEKAEDVGKIVE